MKTTFQLEKSCGHGSLADHGLITISGACPEHDTYVSIDTGEDNCHFIKDRDLERFAVNILKALKSKRLKP